jgi:hypothetical protein
MISSLKITSNEKGGAWSQTLGSAVGNRAWLYLHTQIFFYFGGLLRVFLERQI